MSHASANEASTSGCRTIRTDPSGGRLLRRIIG